MQSKEKYFEIENNVLQSTKNVSPELDYTSLGEAILHNLNDYPDFVGQIDCVTGEEQKYEKMRDRSVRCALWMKAQGLRPEDVVLICTHNHVDVAMACFGALFLGAVFNPLDVGFHLNDFCHMMNITKPKIAFVNEDTAAIIARAAKDINLDLKIVIFGQLPGFLNFESIIAEAKIDEVKNFKCTPVKNANQTAVILCTSGTTGTPKGVALSHLGFLKQFQKDSDRWIQPKTLLFTPLAWLTGTYHVILTVCTNTTRFISPPFEEYTACELIEKYKITSAFMSPSMINRLLKSKAVKKYDISSLKEVMSGGSPFATESQQAFTKLVPHVTLKIGYGLTETGGMISLQTSESKLGSCGRIWEMAQLKVIEPTTGETLRPNQRGELLVKTNVMMNGYYNDPQATAKAIDEEGWMHTGDIGYYDEDGEVYVVDRLKELLKYRGYHISPVEIENLLVRHPGVKEVSVVGLPHAVDDEHPIAFVIKTDSSIYKDELPEKELIDFVAAQVADSKRLRGGVKFVDNLPKTPSGKVQRRDVRAWAKSLVFTKNTLEQNST